MSAVAIVSGVVEGLQLLTTLGQSISTLSSAIQTAQATGQPVDWTPITGAENTVEADILAAIAALKAAGK